MNASRGRRAALGTVVVLVLALVASACTDGAEPSPPESSAPAPSTPAAAPPLTFGVYGEKAEIAAFRSTTTRWNAGSEGADVELESWPDGTAMRRAIESGGDVPDVFLTSRGDLSWLLEKGYTRPVDELLDERGIDFGDDYSRDAIEAFSADDRLQCMPYGVSPMVVYYNKRLVDFDRMRNRELDAPDPDATNWSFEQFAAAADFASRPARRTKGVHVDATLAGLSPFIESGGGSVFDDPVSPTSLAFSGDDSRAALERTLELLRNPQVTLDERKLDRAGALEWFKRGKLGMIAGYRSLVPELRQVPGLDFDVLPMPVLDSPSTVGDVTGLCLSADAASAPAAADFMVHQLSTESVGEVTSAGYLAPANLKVSLTDAFLQPGSEPEHAAYFNSSVRSIRLAPLIDTLPELSAAVQPYLDQLVYGVGALDLEGLTEQIDEASRAILDPESVSESPSSSESADAE